MKVLLTQLRRRREDARENLRGVVRVIERSRLTVSRDDILVLPELIGGELARTEFERLTSELGRAIGCHVVGGTNHHTRMGKTINSGVVSDPQGTIITSYDKLRP